MLDGVREFMRGIDNMRLSTAFVLVLTMAASGWTKPAAVKSYRGMFFEVQYPATFNARNLDGETTAQSNAATFTSPDGTVEFYIFSPQWAGKAPGIDFDASKEVEAERSAKKSGTGVYTWYTYRAKDRSYTRTYQDFLDSELNVHWVIGLKYRSEDDFARYRSAYLEFKKSLKQFSD